MAAKRLEKFVDLPVGTRISYPESPQRIFVIVESRGYHGCGVIAEWSDDIPLGWIGQGIFMYSETREQHDTAMAAVVG